MIDVGKRPRRLGCLRTEREGAGRFRSRFRPDQNFVLDSFGKLPGSPHPSAPVAHLTA